MNEKELYDTMTLATGDFLSDVSRLFPDDNKDIKLVREFGEKLGGEKLSKHVSRYILEYEKEITTRDSTFFRKNKERIFMGLPKKKVDRFEQLIFNGKSDDNLIALWRHFDIFLFLSKEYEKITT
jgi:hypothetical protein